MNEILLSRDELRAMKWLYNHASEFSLPRFPFWNWNRVFRSFPDTFGAISCKVLTSALKKYLTTRYQRGISDEEFFTFYGFTEIYHRMYAYDHELASIMIPDSVKSIEWGGFLECISLKSITIPNTLTSISEGAFCSCESLASIILPDTLTFIGEDAFEECNSLESITIPGSVMNIEKKAFFNCRKLASVIISESVKSIGSWAFSRCPDLKSVVLPNSVQFIDEYAFSEAASCILSYNGTKAQWNRIKLRTTSLGQCTVICSDGEILTWKTTVYI